MMDTNVYEQFVDNVIACALSEDTDTGNVPLDYSYDVQSLIPSARKYLHAYCAMFIDIVEALGLVDDETIYGNLAYYFYKTANKSGVSFTDSKVPWKNAKKLDAVARQFYSFTLYETGNGRLDINSHLYNVAKMHNAQHNEAKSAETIDDLLGEL